MRYEFLRTEENIKLINSIFDVFTSPVLNQELFNNLFQFSQQHPVIKLDPNSIKLLKIGLITKDQFNLFAIDQKMVDGVPMHLPEIILSILCDLSILRKYESNTINNRTSVFQVNNEIVNQYKNKSILHNRIFGFDYIIKKYLKSVIKIENKLNDQVSIGNGFVIEKEGKSLILTNMHVVDKYDDLILKDFDENQINFEKIIKSEKSDLALIFPANDISYLEQFIFKENLEILDDLITIGYPPIPTTKKSYPLCHKGEINSEVENYWGDTLFIFSAKTNPGNSGSPIIANDGTILGIVTQQLEEQKWYEKGKLPYYAGIPSSEIINFISSI